VCGICGIAGDRELPGESTERVRAMCGALVHRGPDDEGFYADASAALGMRRLAIIDVAGGQQPIANEDESLWIVFNGEIYNHTELRSELEARGHRFRTRSDTEVIVHAYEEWGDDCPAHLAGMFAFTIWDRRRRRLYAARDRLGQKPFYYARRGEHLVFGSELKALLHHPEVGDEIDEVALYHYLSLQYVPDPWSIYRGVRKLPAAHWLSFEAGRLSIERYWRLDFLPKLELDERQAAGELRRLLAQAVRRRLMSEVPLGAFLSGGIDSSIIVGLMAEHSSTPVETFSIGFTFESLNELPYARQIAERWGTEHHEFVVTAEGFDDLLPRLTAAFDEPYADASAFQTYHLARETRRHVTVALNGDGGDECFAGYTRYWLDRYVRPYALLPPWITQRLVPALVGRLPEPRQAAIEANWVLGLKRLAQVARVSPKASILRWGSYFDEAWKAELYREEARARLAGADTSELLAASFDAARAESFLDRTLAVDSENYLSGDILVKADRMTMAHSLEGRSPFLDHQLLEFVARLPERFKLRGRRGKVLLRRACADLLPPAIERRPKRGFGAPLEAWLRDELRGAVHELLLSPEAKLSSIFSRRTVLRMVEEHETGRCDHGRRIWALLMLESWWRQQSSSR
jgi:asparagine synthase (glutamine-hydrolysing)